jgi:hypothetical protein
LTSAIIGDGVAIEAAEDPQVVHAAMDHLGHVVAVEVEGRRRGPTRVLQLREVVDQGHVVVDDSDPVASRADVEGRFELAVTVEVADGGHGSAPVQQVVRWQHGRPVTGVDDRQISGRGVGAVQDDVEEAVSVPVGDRDRAPGAVQEGHHQLVASRGHVHGVDAVTRDELQAIAARAGVGGQQVHGERVHRRPPVDLSASVNEHDSVVGVQDQAVAVHLGQAIVVKVRQGYLGRRTASDATGEGVVHAEVVRQAVQTVPRLSGLTDEDLAETVSVHVSDGRGAAGGAAQREDPAGLDGPRGTVEDRERVKADRDDDLGNAIAVDVTDGGRRVRRGVLAPQELQGDLVVARGVVPVQPVQGVRGAAQRWALSPPSPAVGVVAIDEAVAVIVLAGVADLRESRRRPRAEEGVPAVARSLVVRDCTLVLRSAR